MESRKKVNTSQTAVFDDGIGQVPTLIVVGGNEDRISPLYVLRQSVQALVHTYFSLFEKCSAEHPI